MGNTCLQWKMQTHGCGSNQKWFIAMCLNSIYAHAFNLLWDFFLSKTLHTCLKCNFQQSFTPADCKTLLWGDVASLQQWAHIHKLPKVLFHPLHCHPKITHRCSSQEACGMIIVGCNCFSHIFSCFSYAK